VPPDTITTREQQFLVSIAPRAQQVQTVLQSYSLELKDEVKPDFAAPPAWAVELRRRMTAAGVVVEPRHDSIGYALLTDELARRVTRRAFGDAEAKRRALADDRALMRAIELLQGNRTTQELLRSAR